jgi:hypothetical protein
MPAFHELVYNFNSGEWSPMLAARVDLKKYSAACQLLENFILLPYGGVIRRPGTQYLGRAKFADKRCRLIGFNFSVTTNFVLEFGNLYVRFWTNGIQVMDPAAPANPLEKVTPYLEADLATIQYCQINDLMYMTHPKYPPQKLTRLADDNWTFAEIAWTWPPFQEENIKNISITTTGTSGTINMHADTEIWGAHDVGTTWQIGHNVAGSGLTYTEVALGVTTANSAVIRVRGPWSFTTYGTWSGEVRLIRKIYRTGVTETIRTYHNTVDGQRNVASSGNEDDDCEMHIAFITGGTAGSSTPTARLEFSNAVVYGLVKITAFFSTQDVQGTVLWGLRDTTPTTRWSEPAFSPEWGYPRTVCLHEQRLLFGGTAKKPLSIHGSQIDDYENFQRGSLADQAYLFNLAANESNPIQWMITQQKLLLGTAGDEWSLGPQNEDNAMGPGNIKAAKQSNFGSAYLQARVVNEVVLFCQRQGKKLRELTYSFEKDGWVAPDLTLLGAHIAGSGFRETAFCQQPDAVFWCITNEGHLVGMTYERDQQVVGWHRHSTTDGTFESVATIYGGDNADEVWLSVQRTIAGQPVRYIERFDPNFRPTFEAEDKANYWYLDSARRVTSETEGMIVTGLDHLEGQTVGILGDGANQPTRVVSGGQITIQEPVTNVLVGLPYTSQVKPMNINIPSQDGTTQGRKVRIHETTVRFYKSLTCQFSPNGDEWDEIFFRDRVDLMDTSPSIYTGDQKVATGATFTTQQAITLRQTRPFPCCVLAMVLWANYYGD